MTVLDRAALEASPLADLHAIATELGVDGFRRLRKDDLIDAIVARQGGEEAPAAAPESEPETKPRARRGGRGRGRARDRDPEADEPVAEAASAEEEPEEEEQEAKAEEPEERPEERPAPRRSRTRGGRGRPAAAAETEAPAEERVVEGTVELLGNGSAFVRVSPPDQSDEDAYLSQAQVRRCELVDGDVVSGPVRPPRRSERYASLVRVDTINGNAAEEAVAVTRFDDLPAAWATDRFALGGDDPTVKAIEWLTPFGKGSRVAIVGGPRAGKTEALRRIAAALSGVEDLTISLVLAGARPEELGDWPIEPTETCTLSASPDAQARTIERAVEQARRVTARGGDAVVLIDHLDGVSSAAARRTMAAARNVPDGGSLTVIAVTSRPIGGETTVVTLDPHRAATGQYPALDLASSGTLHAELLVGDAGAEAIAKARAEAVAG